MSAKLLNLTSAQVVERARSCLDDMVHYRLKYPNGGQNPETEHPFVPYPPYKKVADCIGLVLWAEGISRTFNGTDTIPPFPATPHIAGPSINCQSLVDEMMGFKRRKGQPDYPGGRFFSKQTIPRPGDMIVFSGNPHGHIAVIVEVPTEAPLILSVDNWITRDQGNKKAALRIIHCSPSNEKKFLGHAVAETDAWVFRGKGAHFVHLNREELLGRTIV